MPLPQVSLSFTDLGRSIAGRPGDPIELRPFEFDFSRDKITSSCKKLGLSPVHLKTALQHKRVRDDSSDGSRALHEQTVRERHTKTLQMLGGVGLASEVLVVPAPPALPPAPDRTFLASPSQAERRFKALKAAGTCAGAIFHSVGAKAFNAPEITQVAVEKVEEKKAIEAEKNQKASSDFYLLRTRAEGIMETVVEGAEYSGISQDDRRALVSYMYKAQDLTGATKITASVAASLEYLEVWTYEEVQALIADPPCLKGKGRVAKGMADTVVVAQLSDAPEDAPMLMGPMDTQLLAFGEVPGVDFGDLLPVKLPVWMEEAIAPESQTAESVVAQHILYRWPRNMGGWARGTVSAVNTDKAKKIGKEVCNYLVHYPVDGDTSQHLLETDEYATNGKAVGGSWVLLGKGE